MTKAIDGDQNYDFTEYYNFIIEHRLPVLVYVGEFDMRDGPVTMFEWMRNIKILKERDPSFWDMARRIYYAKDTDGS